jgi:putative transposase
MPGRPRYRLVGVPQHVIQRGNNRQACFFAEADYHGYLDALKKACDKYGCQVHAYVLMTNHVHLLMTPDEPEAVSQVMQSVGRRYVRYVNSVHRRTGTLWEGRYKASLIDSERYLLSCYRYIELNPVRAGMVAHPAEYYWSSYKANAQGAANGLLTPQPIARRAAYRELFRTSMAPDLMDEIRFALNHDLVVGAGSFKEEVEALTGRATSLGRPGRPAKKEY